MNKVRRNLQILVFSALIALLLLAGIAVAGGEPPVIGQLSPVYVMEGEKVDLTINAVDPEGDDILFGLINRPVGSVFSDNGDGTVFYIRPGRKSWSLVPGMDGFHRCVRCICIVLDRDIE